VHITPPTVAPHIAADCSGIDPAGLSAVLSELCQARRALALRSRESLITALVDVVDAWLAPSSPWFGRAIALLPEATGLSPAMLSHALPTMLEPLRGDALAELVARQVGDTRGPTLIAHILPGNIPGLAAIAATLSLAIGSAALLKAGHGDRIFPPLFAESIAERDPELGRAIAPCYWPGGTRECEDVALAAADLVVASGDDATIEALVARARGRFIGYGHRISFAAVAAEIVADSGALQGAAEQLAEDVALWDQRGCLSPQLCFVEGPMAAACRFGELTAAALRELAGRLPPGVPTTAERLAVRRFRDEAEWRGFAGQGTMLFALDGENDGTIVIEPDPIFAPSPLGRSLRVLPVDDLAALGDLLAPVRGVLEGAGIAAPQPRWSALAEWLAMCGVHRVAPLGELQRPPLDWHQGGRPRLADWVAERRR
jgi:hypothetical protein